MIISFKYRVEDGEGYSIIYTCDKKTYGVLDSFPLFFRDQTNINMHIRFSNEKWPLIKEPDDIVVYACTLANPHEKIYFNGPITLNPM